MKPAEVLGFDPAPGDADAVDGLSDALHRVMRGLVTGRGGLDILGRAGSVWDGPSGAPVVAVLRRYTASMAQLEEALLGCLQALDAWSRGSAERRLTVTRLVEAVADLAGLAGVEERRGRLLVQARDVEVEHRRGAKELITAFESLAAVATTLTVAHADLAADLNAALLARSEAVERWIEQEAPALLRSAATLSEVAGLTTVISDLVGVAALHRTPEEAAGARAVVAGSPAAYRLIKALHTRWAEVAPNSLPAASFAAARRTGLADALAPRDGDEQAASAAPAGPAVSALPDKGGPRDAG